MNKKAKAGTVRITRALKALAILLLGMLASKVSLASETKEPKDQPNILFIITDQHHAKMLSSAGNPYLKTRALDSMAKSGIRFANAYVTNPVCVPSRISMSTGMMAGRFGVFSNGMKAKIPKTVGDNSLGKLIKSGGYDTFYGGKVHMAPVLSPLKAGYDEFCRDQRDELPEVCIEFMTRKRDKPFFAVASFINPHDICFAYNARQPDRKGKPLVDKLYNEAQALPADKLPPLPKNSAIPEREPDAIEATMKVTAVTPAKLIRKDYNERDWRNYRWIYCRLTERVDAQIGQLLDALKKNGLEKNTLVVFTSDHGDMDGNGQEELISVSETTAFRGENTAVISMRKNTNATTCLGDINFDSEVDVSDLLILIGDWGICVDCISDLDGDGIVRVNDILILISNWGACE
ncbi:MAG: sulfatase-like hydrolase/transferase [Opitutales bacterium]|nr:sulfatase-like hydrolase/transferase [Opitutales bacterium]